MLLLVGCCASVSAQSSLALSTESERHAADVASYVTLGANVALAVADCRHDGAWDRTCLIRLGVKNGGALALDEALKRLVHETRPCEPSRCGIDHGTGSWPSGHAALSFVNVDPWGRTHVGLGVEFSFASATSALRVLSERHNWWDVLSSAVYAQGINAVTHRAIH